MTLPPHVQTRRQGNTEHSGTITWAAGWKALLADRAAMVSAAFLLIVVIVAVVAPLIAPETYAGYDFHHGSTRPELNFRYLFGADVNGHSILTAVILGARTTLGVGMLASVCALIPAIALAFATKFVPAWLRSSICFIAGVWTMLPFLPLVVVIAAYGAGGNPWWIGLTLGLVAIPWVFKALSGLGDVSHNQPDEARSSSETTRDWNLVRTKPRTVAGRLLRVATLVVSSLVAVSATVDFLGFGLPASNPSWGNALANIVDYFDAGYWWWLMFPGLALSLTLLAINILGRALYYAVESPELY